MPRPCTHPNQGTHLCPIFLPPLQNQVSNYCDMNVGGNGGVANLGGSGADKLNAGRNCISMALCV